MDKLLAKDVAKGRLTEIDAQAARARVRAVAQDRGIGGLRDVDMVIEVRAFKNRLLLLNSVLGSLGKSFSEAESLSLPCARSQSGSHPCYEHILYQRYEDRCRCYESKCVCCVREG